MDYRGFLFCIMAKELPYFKFEPSEWENGNIQMCSREEKGLFIDLCALYWSRLGDVPLKLASQKLCGGNASAFDSLIDSHLIRIKDASIYIEFLEEQLQEFENLSNQNKKNALLGWEKRRENKALSERNATASNPQCENDAIREEKKRKDERREEERKEKETLFEIFWKLYDHKKGKEVALKSWMKIDINEMSVILKAVPEYVRSTPDKAFRKHPSTYLNGKHWNDEITFKQQNNGTTNTKSLAQQADEITARVLGFDTRQNGSNENPDIEEADYSLFDE